MNKKLYALATLLLLLLAACAPRTQSASTETNPVLSSPAAQETERVAMAAYHRMELAQLEDGVYTTNVLINLDVPQGVRWMLEDLTDTPTRSVSPLLTCRMWLGSSRLTGWSRARLKRVHRLKMF